MKVTFVHGDRRHAARVPYDGCAHVEIDACPAGCEERPCKVAGIRGTTHNDHDTHYSDAITLCCGAAGQLQVRVSTIFGIDEDRAVLCGRARVY